MPGGARPPSSPSVRGRIEDCCPNRRRKGEEEVRKSGSSSANLAASFDLTSSLNDERKRKGKGKENRLFPDNRSILDLGELEGDSG